MKTKVVVTALFLGLVAIEMEAQSLKGSPESIGYQFLRAQSLSLPFPQTAKDVQRLIEAGNLVELLGNDDYELFEVSHPYVLPTTKLFVELFANEYRETCHEKLVVTSEVRPIDEQPANASPFSVHPTGMSVDFRVPEKRACRRFLERTLLSFEGGGSVDVTKEVNPHHYHVAVFYVLYTRSLVQTD